MRVTVEIGFSFKRELPDDYRSLDLADGADVAAALRALADRHPGSPRPHLQPGRRRAA